MAPEPKLIIALRSHTDQGRKIIGDRWLGLFFTIRTLLREDTEELPESGEQLLLFRDSRPETAIEALFTRIDEAKKEYQWEKSLGPAPVQIVIHWTETGELPPLLNDPLEKGWDSLAYETPYLTTALRQQWPELIADGKVPPHQLGEEANGLAPLIFPERVQTEREPLFPSRRLALSGKHKPCFYCGMTSHTPAACPSKMLSIQTQGLPTLGYLPLEQLDALFREALNREKNLINTLSAGISPTLFRKDPVLRIYVSYFDLNKVYQPRFLTAIAFSPHNRWSAIGRPEAVTSDSHGLHLGLDCLRVGQYSQAEEMFLNENRQPKGKQLYATIGRAFVSLEQGRIHDMGHYLESALRMANKEKERIYLNLLLSRHFQLLDDNWKAEQTIDNILSIDRECPDALYRQVEIGAATGFGDRALRQLRSLVMADKELFIRALMDPALLPIEEAVEDILASRAQSQSHDAAKMFGKAVAVCRELNEWLAPEAPELQAMLNDLAIIEQQESQQSYYDLIDVAEKSRLLLQSCYRLQEAKIETLNQRIGKAAGRHQSLFHFWRQYTYPSLFPEFAKLLGAIKETIAKAREGAGKNMHGKLYRILNESLDQTDEQFEQLGQMRKKMALARTLLDSGKYFLKALVISELALLTLLFVLGAALLAMPADSALGALGLALRDSWLQKQVLTGITLMLAPAIALARTLWVMTEG